ncbi:N,N'-diacetylbacillosaminyl-diphospho-undecaprenol alpha-1,3-N-acetylgalactosaminyltransferase [Planctomycetes bacterium Pan216]|uniref:N, N'-diacetylbacillosaminyl-diphospho-undecaprenol alpha-1,3-N-acetylgalactosaminyltransferase n=1 Tax=Kolteria novifilia TaxID=2527975 RepID=A0A518B633_9BACT|nr:N,N'-diacetylbacillosaminyl-diphospho-undecaprenol alpha-1,3-N-acetylgalactosaminyltransferase [Planctomycetes bacterium Pan216]
MTLAQPADVNLDVTSAAKPRIAICISHFHPVVGGAEQYLLRLARRWAQAGHEPIVITRQQPKLPDSEIIDGIAIERSIGVIDKGPLFGLSFVASLARSLIRFRHRYDVILAGQAPWEAIATGLVGPLLRKPSAVQIMNTGSFGDVAQLERAKLGSMLQRFFRRNDRLLAISEHAAEELRRIGVPRSKIAFLSSSVDVEAFAPPTRSDPERDRSVLFVGRLADQKNPTCLLEAWRRLGQHHGARLLLAGAGPLEGTLRDIVRDQKLESVAFLGQVADMPSLYRRASLFVLPSLSEGCSNALLEAMACGLCPVVTDIGGNRDVVRDGDTGRLVRPNDAEHLASVLGELVGNPEERRRLGTAARDWVSAHRDIKIVANEYAELFRELHVEQE